MLQKCVPAEEHLEHVLTAANRLIITISFLDPDCQ